MNRVWIVLAAVVISVWPQQPQFRTRSDIVEVYTTVTAKDGAKVTDLRGDEFELFEDGKPRDIAVFSALVQPLSVAIILDHSGSTTSEFSQVLQAAGVFIGRLFKEDRARIDTLGWDCAPFTGERAKLIDTLQKPMPADPGSPIWSATDRAMAALVPESGRRVILLLSDGIDNQRDMLDVPARSGRAGAPPVPQKTPTKPPTHDCVRADTSKLVILPDVIDRAERESVMVYAVAVPSRDPGGGVAIGGASSIGASGPPLTGPPLIERDPHADLTKLAKRSGGSVQQLSNYEQLTAAFKVIADELHLQYLIGFVPSKFDGKRHDITVRVKRPGVVVRARESYFGQAR
jgi:VWFA-related protein